MGINKYMRGLADKARKKVQDTVENLPPMKRLGEGLAGGLKPKTKLTPAKKRKKIKPKERSDFFR